MENNKEKKMVPGDLPVKDAFEKKEVFQHPQPAGQGKPLNKDEKEVQKLENDDKEQERTSKEEGLNQVNSAGEAGAFEGFEDQGDRE